MKTHPLLIGMITMVAIVSSCTSKTGTENVKSNEPEMRMLESPEAPDTSSKEYSSAYICPMHCEGSGSDEPGNCPNCGMEYVQNPQAQAEAHYSCPMHPEEHGREGDQCPICGMNLEEVHTHEHLH